MLDLRAHLLFPSQMSRQIFVDVQIRNLFDEPSGRAGGIEAVLAQDAPVGDAEILHEFFLRIMCDQRDIHNTFSPIL